MMFDQILWLAMNSEGGIDYQLAYHMPIAYRLIAIKKISKKIEDHNKEMEKSQNKGTSLTLEDLAKRNDFKPDYVTSKAAPKK